MPRGGGRGGGGGSPNAGNFDIEIIGPPPGDLSVKKDHFIDLGLIPTGQRIWFGVGVFTSPDKSFTFEIRTSIVGKSAGTNADTDLLARISATPKKGQVLLDMYKKNRLHTMSVIGTGVEHFWLRLKSRKNTFGEYIYHITYTFE